MVQPLLLAAGICLSASLWSPAAEINTLQSTTVDVSALNFSESSASFSQNVNGRTYQRHPMSTLNGYQYTTYYDSNRKVCLGRRKLPSGSWEIIRFNDYTIPGNDSHNVVTMGICALDGTIHLAFDHHVHPLNYRVSNLGVASDPDSVTWSTSLFGPVTSNLGSLGSIDRVTYPTFFNAPNGNLMLYYRYQGSGNGDGMLLEYDGSTHDWSSGMGKFIARTGSYTGTLSTNSTSRNPYINGISYAGDRLHVSWGWRESSGGSQFNHDLAYAYSDDDGRTWRNSNGNQIGTTGSSFIKVNSTGVRVAEIPQNIGLSNQYTHYAYPDGSCHVIVVHNLSGTSEKRYHHYWRNASGTWSSEALPFTGSRPKVAGDDDGTLFLSYTSGGTARIAKGVPNATKTSWSWNEIHAQSGTSEGGEGHIDYTRWETDRILSIYGQGRTNEGGDPTALRVVDYQVSTKAILPEPTHQATGISVNTTLQWTAGIEASTHRVYFGTNAQAVANATPSSPEYQGRRSLTSWTPASPLVEGVTYYWRIDELSTEGSVTPGLLWSFTTGPDLPPTIVEIPDQSYPKGVLPAAVPLLVDDDFTDPDDLMVTAISSNQTLLPDAELTVTGTGGSRTLQMTPVPGRTGTSVVTITVADGTHLTEESFTLSITNEVITLFSEAADASVRETSSVVDVSKVTTLLGTGGASPRVDRCTIYVFQLPDLGPIPAPFATASFSFEYTAKQGDLHDNDLYGLDRRAAPDVLSSDYYGKTNLIDSGSSLLQPSILTNSTPFGLLTTSAAGDTALRDYLNAQYASGAGAGEFVFLRLNTADKEDSIDRATLTMSEGATTAPIDTRPRISTTTISLSGQEEWRVEHFGSPANTGDGADDSDPNQDGESNFLEFATAQDPYAATLVSTPLIGDPSDLELSYTRSKAALADGVTFAIEWSNTLLPDSWSTTGVSEMVVGETDETESVIVSLPTTPNGPRFYRLRVSK